MGSHFDTCLSPGNVNFFSVFANCADINKHVVYGRDRKGRVLGRCLIALTEEGGLITFTPYCHDPKLGFAEMMAKLVNQLASDMKTVVVPRGNIPHLVASDWYDDGPRDFCNRFEFLKPKSSLQQSLKTMKLDEVVPGLTAAFAPIALNALSLPLIVEMEVFDERPELVLPLLPYVEACKELAERAWLRTAALAHRAGEFGFAYRVLRRQAVPYLLRQYRRLGRCDREVLQILVEHDPSAALQVLRRTRARGVRDDSRERDSSRVRLLALAHEKLNRPHRAHALRNNA